MFSVLLPAFTNLFEFISRLSNHMGQNKHTFHSQPFTFACAALWSVCLSGYCSAGEADKKETADRIQPKLPVKLSAVCGRRGRWNPLPRSLCLCGVALGCPVWPVARRVNDPAYPQFFQLPYFHCFLSLLGCRQTRPARKRSERIVW